MGQMSAFFKPQNIVGFLHFIEYKDKEDCSEWLYNYLYNSTYLYSNNIEDVLDQNKFLIYEY